MYNNNQQYHHQSGPPPPPPRSRMDLVSEGPPPGGHSSHHQHSYIPHGSFQNQVSPFAGGSAFQDNTFSEVAYNQHPSLGNTFQRHGYPHHHPPPPPPQPDFSQPPPPLSSTGGFTYSQTAAHPRMEFNPYQNFGPFSTPAQPPHVGFSHPVPTACGENVHPATLDLVSFPANEMEGTANEDADDLTGEDKELLWLRDFEQKIIANDASLQESVTTKEALKLSDVQQLIIRSRQLTDQLCQLQEKMGCLTCDVDEDIWKDLVKEAEDTKLELKGITKKFQDKCFIEDVRRLIQQRRKKRERNRRQHKQKVKEKKELKMRWKKEEEKIDAWREKLHLQEEEKRREVAIKAEADSILGEVRQKQMDGIKMQQLLEKLISLRVARLNKGATHGFVSTPQKDQLFSTTLDKIADVVKSQMAEYKLEEQTLCVMMEESTSYKRSHAGKEPKEPTSRLEMHLKKVIFGDIPPIDQDTHEDFTGADKCLEVFLQRRHEWDQFICEEDIPLASSVPLGWVIPPTNPSESWAKYQG